MLLSLAMDLLAFTFCFQSIFTLGFWFIVSSLMYSLHNAKKNFIFSSLSVFSGAILFMLGWIAVTNHFAPRQNLFVITLYGTLAVVGLMTIVKSRFKWHS